MDTAEGYVRLAEAVAARREQLNLTQMEVAQGGGLSLDRVSAIERGEARNLRPRTIRALERGLKWVPGSVRAVLEGGEPGIAASGDQPGLTRLPAKGTARSGPVADVLATLPEDREARLRALSALLDQMAEESERRSRDQRTLMEELSRLLRDAG